MTIKSKCESFIEEYNQKIQELQARLQDATEKAEYLQLEIRFIQEKELPEAQSKAVLEGTDESHVKKLKKKLSSYQDLLQDAQERQLILQHAIKQHTYQAGEKLVELERLYRHEKSIAEAKQYSKMMYYKKQYVDALIEEGKVIQEMNKVDSLLQHLLVTSGRKNGVYTDTNVRQTASNNGNGNYLGITPNEVSRFIKGNYSISDYDYLKKHISLKDLSV